MNSGKVGLTPEQVAQQQIAGQQMQAYWKLQAPALGYALNTADTTEPGAEQRAAGVASNTIKTAGARQIQQIESEGDIGSGGSIAKIGQSNVDTAGRAAVGAGMGRAGQRMAYAKEIGGIGGVGEGMVNRANSAAETAGSTSGAAAAQRAQGKASNVGQIAQLAALTAAIAL